MGRPASGPNNAPVYIVFFHYDSANLTPVGQEIVDQAAKSVHATLPTRIEIAGYTEASAPIKSRPLVEPRFKVVEDRLIADGVDPKLLVRVPLADKEADLPPNGDRRVEIRPIGRLRP